MFAKKQKSVPEKIVTFIGDKVDGHVMGIAKNFGKTALAIAAAVVGTSAVINSVRDEDSDE